jgi:hypothetical protein
MSTNLPQVRGFREISTLGMLISRAFAPGA